MRPPMDHSLDPRPNTGTSPPTQRGRRPRHRDCSNRLRCPRLHGRVRARVPMRRPASDRRTNSGPAWASPRAGAEGLTVDCAGPGRWPVRPRPHLPLVRRSVTRHVLSLGSMNEDERRDARELAGLWEILPYALILRDASGSRVIRVNAAAEQLIGTDRDGLRQRLVHEVFTPELCSAITQADQLSEPDAVRGDRWPEVHTPVGVFSVQTVLIDSVRGAGRDRLTIVRETSVERRRWMEFERLTEIVETSPDFISFGHRDHGILYNNPAFVRTIGDPGSGVEGFRRVHPDWAWDRIANEGIPEAMEKGVWRGETAIMNRFGAEIPVDQIIIAHRNDAGDVERTSTIMRDISVLKAKTRELEQSRAAAEAASQAKSAFLANMSHEIRTPMNGVLGMANELSLSSLDARQQECLSVLSNSARALLSLINDILDLSKVESGKLELESVTFDPHRLAVEVGELFAASARERGVRLEHRVDNRVAVPVRGDPLRIRQVLTNLLGNAVKFTQRGRVTLTLTATGPDRIRFEVADTGIGMSQETLQRIFDPFEQADSSTTRRFGGTGLGTTICHRLVQLMGGTLQVESELGVGSRFWFELRLASANDTPHARPPAATATVTAAARPLRVLVAEDNVVNQKVIKMLLRRLGHDVTLVEDGQAAVEAVAAASFDVVLMDCQMPTMDGLEATRRIRERTPAGAGHLPILALTANTMQGDRERCLAAGMDDHLPKPLDYDRVAEALSKIAA
ncbi:MAG: response regulator [Myxococcales bacterium FL481]|nr:MAG: response regulator [Myxococcales bacterium FL481]